MTTIEEAKQKKLEMEQALTTMFGRFYEETGLKVTDVRVNRYTVEGGGRPFYGVAIDVELWT